MQDVTTARATAENEIYELMDDLDPSGYNTNMYKEMFKKMNNTEFTKFMETLQLFFEVDSMDKKNTPDLNKIKKIAAKHGVELTEYVVMPHKNPDDPENPIITRTKIPVLVLQSRRLQQMIEKKNAASSNIDKINPITGQVTGDAKAASLSDMQTMSLVTSGQLKTIKEFLGPRADDKEAKLKMLETIYRTGTFNIDDLELNTEDKQSISTMKIFLMGAGFDVRFGNTQKKKKNNTQ